VCNKLVTNGAGGGKDDNDNDSDNDDWDKMSFSRLFVRTAYTAVTTSGHCHFQLWPICHHSAKS